MANHHLCTSRIYCNIGNRPLDEDHKTKFQFLLMPALYAVADEGELGSSKTFKGEGLHLSSQRWMVFHKGEV